MQVFKDLFELARNSAKHYKRRIKRDGHTKF
jgi:hypothetical protein